MSARPTAGPTTTRPKSGRPTVAVLHLGEMGAAIAAVLKAAAIRVVTHLDGCGDKTVRRCRATDVEVLQPDEVYRASDIVISLVPPDAATAVAEAFCKSTARRGTLYVDANSISPDHATAIARRVESTGRDFVDAAINGLAKSLTKSGTLFLSGDRASEVAALFEGRVHAQVLGSIPGKASAIKMLLAGVSKGVCALYAELSLLAEAQHLLPEFSASTRVIYPAIAALAERVLPTYATHATRRAAEMRELVSTTDTAGIDAPVIEAIASQHDALAVHLQRHPATLNVSLSDFLRHLRETDFRATPPDRRHPAAVAGAVTDEIGDCHGQ